MRRIAFAKYSGAGNDFILIDNRRRTFPASDRDLIRQMCTRRVSVGADGLILLEAAEDADIRMRLFNADGGEAEMSGNGLRCLVAFARRRGVRRKRYRVRTMQRLVTAEANGDRIVVEMGAPVDTALNLTVDVGGTPVDLHYTNTGVPHAALFVPDVEAAPVVELGRKIRRHVRFSPAGTNVDFVEVVGTDRLRVRSYERGVEDETLACGTGVAASAVVAALLGRARPPVSVQVRSGDVLGVDFERVGEAVGSVRLSGPATLVYEGTYFAA